MDDKELHSLLKSYLQFGIFTLAAAWVMNLGRKRQVTLVHREKDEGWKEQWNVRVAGESFLRKERWEVS